MKWKTERAVKTNPVKSQWSHILFETHGWWKSALVHLMGSTCRSVESFNLFISLQTPSKCDTKQAVNWSVQHCITLPIQITPYMLQWAVSQQPQENIISLRSNAPSPHPNQGGQGRVPEIRASALQTWYWFLINQIHCGECAAIPKINRRSKNSEDFQKRSVHEVPQQHVHWKQQDQNWSVLFVSNTKSSTEKPRHSKWKQWTSHIIQLKFPIHQKQNFKQLQTQALQSNTSCGSARRGEIPLLEERDNHKGGNCTTPPPNQNYVTYRHTGQAQWCLHYT